MKLTHLEVALPRSIRSRSPPEASLRPDGLHLDRRPTVDVDSNRRTTLCASCDLLPITANVLLPILQLRKLQLKLAGLPARIKDQVEVLQEFIISMQGTTAARYSTTHLACERIRLRNQDIWVRSVFNEWSTETFLFDADADIVRPVTAL